MWEEIDRVSARLKVPNGWIIRYCEERRNSVSHSIAVSASMLFIADFDHQWKLETNV